MSEQWSRVLALDELPIGGAKTVRTAGEQIAVFRVDADTVHAVDNRCPHEGYPLTSGDVKDGLLTCAWHNWKFTLCDGACVIGGEAVRSYAVRIDGGDIYIDVTPPPPEKVIPGLYASLDDAFEENDWGHAARTVVRLLEAGVAPLDVLAHGCNWAAVHARYGFDHGLAVAGDIAALLGEEAFASEPEVLIVQALSLMVEPHLRRPTRALPEPGRARPDTGAELRRLIETEEREAAEALLRGALSRGAGPDEVFGWLTAAATDHFLDFGHAHIYCIKAEELLGAIGWQHADPIAVSLLSSIVYGTREDTLPYMKRFRREMEPITPQLAAWASATGGGRELGAERFVTRILDGDLHEALAAVAEALDRDVAGDRVALGLSVCAAERLMRFDLSIETSEDISEGWLDVTHTLTHADAVRESLLRRPGAETLRGLFHSARFVNHLTPLDGPERAPDGDPPPIDDMVRSIASDTLALPIFVDHHIKMVLAARRLCRALAADDELAPYADLPRIATGRFLAGPHRQRRITRRARNSRAFVSTGSLGTRLLGY